MITELKLFTYNTLKVFFCFLFSPANFTFIGSLVTARMTVMYDNEEPDSCQSQNNSAVADQSHVHRPASPITLASEMAHTRIFGPVHCTATHRHKHTTSSIEKVNYGM